MDRLRTLAQREKHHGEQEDQENSRKETKREASFVGKNFIEERLAAGPVQHLALSASCELHALLGRDWAAAPSRLFHL